MQLAENSTSSKTEALIEMFLSTSANYTVPQAFRVDFCVFWCFLCALSRIFFNPAPRSPKVGKNVDKSLLIIAVG